MRESFQNTNSPDGLIPNEQDIAVLQNKSREKFTASQEQMDGQIIEFKKRVGEEMVALTTYIKDRVELLGSGRFGGFSRECEKLKTKIEG